MQIPAWKSLDPTSPQLRGVRPALFCRMQLASCLEVALMCPATDSALSQLNRRTHSTESDLFVTMR